MSHFFLFWHLVGHSYIYNIADGGTTSMRHPLGPVTDEAINSEYFAMTQIKIYPILLLFGLTNFGLAQPVFEPDEYSVFYESNFRLKCKIKSDETGKLFYRWTGSVDSLNFVSWNAQDSKKLDQYSQTYQCVHYAPLEKKTRYKFSWKRTIGGIDSTRFSMGDTASHPNPYYVERILDDSGRLKKLIRMTAGGDTIDIRRFEYDSLNHLTLASWSRCNDCGITMHFDSTTNAFVSEARANCNCEGNKLTFQYETDKQGRVQKKTVVEVAFGTEKLTEIRTIYRNCGRKQINLYSFYYKQSAFHERRPERTNIPRRIKLLFDTVPDYDAYYSISRYDRKGRVKVYRYFNKNTSLKKKFSYRKYC